MGSALILPEDFSEFLGKLSPYTTNAILDKEKSVMVAKSILKLDEGLNHIFGTKAYTLTKPKEKAVKIKRERQEQEEGQGAKEEISS